MTQITQRKITRNQKPETRNLKPETSNLTTDHCDYGFDARRGRSFCNTSSLARGRPDMRHSIRLIASVAVSAVEELDVRTTGSSSLIVS